ncbi:MAG: IS110 family transposase [Parcubacteria group bacterium]
MKYHIGIDISKRDFHVCFDEGEIIEKFSTAEVGIDSFLNALRKKNMTSGKTLIGMEATGSYHLPVAYQCTQAGYTVNVINPLITKKQNQTNLRRVKTDSADAKLVRQCLMNGAGYPFRETAETIKLKTLVRQRARFSMLRHRTRLRDEETQNRERYLNVKITALDKDLYDFLDERIKALDAELRRYESPTQKLLQSIPGVGPQTAVTCLSEIGDIRRFSDAQKLTAWVGLDSRVHQSGTSINGKGYITKRGNKLLRTRLFNAASVAVLHENMFQKFFLQKRSEGKAYRVALCAVMRKMVHVIHAAWTRGTPFINN